MDFGVDGSGVEVGVIEYGIEINYVGLFVVFDDGCGGLVGWCLCKC